MDANQVQRAADRLSAKLDALDLEPDERAVLEAVCAAGATSVEFADGEVEGFAFDAFGPTHGAPTEPLGVTLDLRKAGGGGKSSGEPFLRYSFSVVFVTS